jgi:Divergent InlB B-repeat domain
MRIQYTRTCLPSIWTLVFIAVLAACGSDSSNGQTVAVNLSLIVDGRQAQHHPAASRLLAWIERWVPAATPAWAQSVTEIASIEVQITGPGIPTPATATVPVSDPTSGQEIPVSIQAPVGPNRTITVTAFNSASPPLKTFGGTLPGVTLTAGAPIDLEITLVRLFTVSVQKEGDGSGTVTSLPVGIDCGATCENQFQEGATVSLNAAAAPGSAFVGWSGACSGSGPCSVASNAIVTARFIVAAATNRLSVVKAGNGSGTVTSNPSGISCGAACSAEFLTASSVVLEAAPTGGSTFTGWSGGGCSGTGACIVVMIADQTVTATFTASAPPPPMTLTVTIGGTAVGTVTSNPGGISCPGTCIANFSAGTTVSLTATPAVGSTFAGWSGDCSGADCSVVMDVNRSVTATFNPPVGMSNLTVEKRGTGSGTVTSQPPGIDCGPTCVAAFPTGTVVTLTATPAAGSTLTGWNGPICGGSGPCTITLDSDFTAFPVFDIAPAQVTLNGDKSGGGNGTVTSDLAGISCGPGCDTS